MKKMIVYEEQNDHFSGELRCAASWIHAYQEALHEFSRQYVKNFEFLRSLFGVKE